MKSWISQFRRGVLELSILTLLSQQSDYGYQLVQRLQEIDGLEVRESTVYPILARLEAEGVLSVRRESSPEGPKRRVFFLSAEGSARLEALNEYFDRVTRSIGKLRSQERSEHTKG